MVAQETNPLFQPNTGPRQHPFGKRDSSIGCYSQARAILRAPYRTRREDTELGVCRGSGRAPGDGGVCFPNKAPQELEPSRGLPATTS